MTGTWPDLAALRHDLVTGDTTAVALHNECLTRIAERDPELGAVVALNPQAGDDAAGADEHLRQTGESLGPLHGIPILVKDVFETRGIPTSFGCRAFRDYVPETDAAAVRRLRAAGAIILGKTATPDFALSWLSDSSIGATVNSRSVLHDAGGSSSGSAVAVAAGLAPAALGSDTGGSVRVPASFNGVVGMRPSPGLVPAHGLSTLVSMQDTPGPLTNCVDDAALLLAVLSGGRLAMSEARRPLERYRLGQLVRPLGPGGWEGSEQVSTVFDKALARLGVPVERVEPPALEGLLRDSSPYLVAARADLDAFLASRPRLRGKSFMDLYDEGVFPEGLDLAELIATRTSSKARCRVELLASRRRLRETVVNVMTSRGLDALVYPTVRVPAPRRDRDRRRLPSRQLPVNTLLASQADLPALTLPVGSTDDGLPVGLELLALPARDAAVLRLARLVEQALES